MNPITCEMEIEIAGKKYILRFDWQALSELQAAHGDAPNLFHADIVASVASIGLKKRHPEMTAERIKELSPPLIPFANAVQKAIQFAYFGPDAVPADSADVKKNRPKDGFWRRFFLR